MLTFKGRAGELRWGYHCAATVETWTITAADQQITLTASVLDADAYRMGQQPIRFVVQRPSGTPWAWPVTTLVQTGTTVTATLGNQE